MDFFLLRHIHSVGLSIAIKLEWQHLSFSQRLITLNVINIITRLFLSLSFNLAVILKYGSCSGYNNQTRWYWWLVISRFGCCCCCCWSCRAHRHFSVHSIACNCYVYILITSCVSGVESGCIVEIEQSSLLNSYHIYLYLYGTVVSFRAILQVTLF